MVTIHANGEVRVDPSPELPLPAGAELLLIGRIAAEDRFLARYGRELS